VKIVAYIYSDPLLESPPEPDIWGLEVDLVYRDLGQRQQLQQLIQDAQTQPPSYLLVRRLEELGDNLQEISDRLAKLESWGIEVIPTQQNYNSAKFERDRASNSHDNLIKLLPEIQNNQYRDRLKRGHAKNRIKALPPPGKAPYGYRRGQDKYIIDKSTAPVVKDFFEQFLLFGSLRGAVRYLEKRYGKKISPSTGKKWLTNVVYRGDLAYKNQQIISNTHAPIISREEAAQIDRLLRRNSSLPSRTASAPRSLAGLLICQQCQFSMTITRVTRPRKKTEYLYLRCHKCPKQPKCQAIAYSEILHQIIKQICIELPLAVDQLNAPNSEKIALILTNQLQEKRDLIEQIAKLTTQGILDGLTADLRNYQLRLEIAQLEQKIAQLPPVNLGTIAKAVSIPQFWLDLSESERRFYFREFIKRIEIIRLPSQEWKLKLVFIFGKQ
jgi:DNA invertase Pin-like site-specific DNA recombinase